MSELSEALENKITVFEDDKERIEDEKERIDEKIILLRELLGLEADEDLAVTPKSKKKRAGRPKGAKNKKIIPSKHAPKDALYEEAMEQVAKLEGGGTSDELQKRRTASFNPTARPQNTPANVRAGTKKAVDAMRKRGPTSDATISVDESDLDD